MVLTALTACGGGSDPNKTGRADPNSQAVGVPYQVVDSNPSQVAGVPHLLHLVDPDTGAVFKSIDIGQHGSHERVGAFTPAANGQGGTRENASVLLFIREQANGQRKLFRASLIGAQAGAETQISNLVDACNIIEAKVARLDAIATWLLVETAGADQLCDNSADNRRVFIRSDAGSAASPFDSPFGRETPLAWEYNDRGELAWLYGYTPNYGWLGAVSVAGEMRQVGNGFTGQTVRAFSAYPGDAHKMLVRVGNAIHVLSWRDGVAILWPLITTVTQPFIHVEAVDDRGVYFAEGQTVRRIDAQGVASVVVNLPANQGDVQVAGHTPTSLLLLQAAGSTSSGSSGSGGSSPAPALPPSVLWVLNKTGSPQPRSVESVPATEGLFVAGVSGETVVYGIATAATSADLTDVTLKRFVANATSPVPTTLVSGARYLYGVGSRQVNAYGDSATSHVLWCDVAGQSHACREDRLRSYNLATGEVVNLGPQTLPAGTPTWELAYADIDYLDRSGRGILEGLLQEPTMPVNQFYGVAWVLDVARAQSLKEVALP